MKLFRSTSRLNRNESATRPLDGSFCAVAACVLSLTLIASAALPSQHSAEKPFEPKAFAGTWKASFRGEIFAILTLKEQRGELSGTLNNFDLRVDRDGNLADGTHKDTGEAPLLNIHYKSGALYFVVAQKDAYAQPTEWKFAVKNDREGELTELLDNQINVPPDTVIKPILMVRDNPKP